MLSLRAAVAGLGLAITAVSGVCAATWQQVPPLGFARAAHAVVVTTEGIYALAGTGPRGPVLDVERFDGHAWSVVARLPGEGLNAPAAVVLDGRIYLIGGFGTTTNVPVDRVHVLDTSTHTWSSAAPLPAPRGGHGAAVLDGRIHVLGGGNSESTLADHDEYDPATDRWRARAPLPRSEGSPAVVVHDGRLLAIGGRSGYADFGDVYVYDADGDRWLPGPPIPPRGTAGAVSHCGAVYLFGGESQPAGRTLGDVLRLDAGAEKWISVEPMPTPRSFARAVTLGGAVYVVGGSPAAGSSHDSTGSTVVERFDGACP